jgi:UDP-glucose 4-epimerase
VPSCEFFPLQAVATNIIGSANVIQSAIAQGVKKLVALSTDKAVYPINAMGMSKALMEKVLQAEARHAANTVLCSVRYGNVMASRGSVIPLFIEQIKAGKPITITDPDMTRFMLPLPEASLLVAYAFEHGATGDLFVRKSPACTVLELANALKNLFHSQVPIETIGTRHGEKLYETLVNREELARASDLGDYFKIPMDGRDLNYGQFISEGAKTADSDYTSHSTVRLKPAELEALLRSLPYVQQALKGGA